MDLSPNDLRHPPKVVGKCGDDPLYELVTRGGLRAIAKIKKGASSYEFLGIGSHRALARNIAKNKNKNCIFKDELAKSEFPDQYIFDRHMKVCEWLSERISERL